MLLSSHLSLYLCPFSSPCLSPCVSPLCVSLPCSARCFSLLSTHWVIREVGWRQSLRVCLSMGVTEKSYAWESGRLWLVAQFCCAPVVWPWKPPQACFFIWRMGRMPRLSDHSCWGWNETSPVVGMFILCLWVALYCSSIWVSASSLYFMKVKVKVAQSCPTLCDRIDYAVHGILQARILEWVAFPFSRGSSQLRDGTQVYHIAGGFFTSWATREAQEYWSGQPVPSQGDLPHPEIEPESPALQADSLPTELSGKPILYFIAPFISVLEPLFASVTVQTEVNGKDSKYRSSPGRLWGGGVLGAGEKHPTRDKGHEEGGSAYAKAGSSLRSAPRYSRAPTPQKPESAYFTALCSHLWLYWGLSPTTSLSLSKS